MPAEIFVDTGAWIGVTDRRDAFHQAAVAEYERLLREAARLVTTNLVVAESYVAIRRAGGHEPAMRFLRSLESSSRVIKVYSDADLENQARVILAQYADQDFSFTDAVSFALMKQRGLAEAFAFDHHFSTAGFVLVPGTA